MGEACYFQFFEMGMLKGSTTISVQLIEDAQDQQFPVYYSMTVLL